MSRVQIHSLTEFCSGVLDTLTTIRKLIPKLHKQDSSILSRYHVSKLYSQYNDLLNIIDERKEYLVAETLATIDQTIPTFPMDKEIVGNCFSHRPYQHMNLKCQEIQRTCLIIRKELVKHFQTWKKFVFFQNLVSVFCPLVLAIATKFSPAALLFLTSWITIAFGLSKYRIQKKNSALHVIHTLFEIGEGSIQKVQQHEKSVQMLFDQIHRQDTTPHVLTEISKSLTLLHSYVQDPNVWFMWKST